MKRDGGNLTTREQSKVVWLVEGKERKKQKKDGVSMGHSWKGKRKYR